MCPSLVAGTYTIINKIVKGVSQINQHFHLQMFDGQKGSKDRVRIMTKRMKHCIFASHKVYS